MLNEIALKYLEAYNSVESKQKKTGKTIIEFPLASYQEEANNLFTFFDDSYFLDFKLYLSKHNRFADFPEHRHNFIEINYVLRGSSTQKVNGEDVYLQEGDILLMNQGCTHSLKRLEENDLLINLAFSFKSLDLYWLEELEPAHAYILNFLIHDPEKGSNQYIIFNGRSNPDVLTIFDSIINKYFTGVHFSKSIIYSYFDILMMELLSNTEADIREPLALGKNNLFNLFLDLNKNFRSITLAGLAQKYGYHKNYLSKLIKKICSQTFSEIVTEKRLERAAFLLTYTQLAIQDILEDINLNNRGYFYEAFKKKFGMTPFEFRKSTHQAASEQNFLDK